MDPGGMLLQDFGQRVDLTRRIREVLANCPEGTTSLRELIQNADDARASRARPWHPLPAGPGARAMAGPRPARPLRRRLHRRRRSLLAPALVQWHLPHRQQQEGLPGLEDRVLRVAALQFGDFYNMQYVKMYTFFMLQLQAILPPGTIPNAYANGSNAEQSFIQNLALFFTAFFKVKPLLLLLSIFTWSAQKLMLSSFSGEEGACPGAGEEAGEEGLDPPLDRCWIHPWIRPRVCCWIRSWSWERLRGEESGAGGGESWGSRGGRRRSRAWAGGGEAGPGRGRRMAWRIFKSWRKAEDGRRKTTREYRFKVGVAL